MEILDKAVLAGLEVLPVKFKGSKRKGYDLIDPYTRHIQYTLEPLEPSPVSIFFGDKWRIDDKEGNLKYVRRVTTKDIDLTKRNLTCFIR